MFLRPQLIRDLEQLARDQQLTPPLLCKKLGISRSYWSDILAGRRGVSLNFARRIEKAFPDWHAWEDLFLKYVKKELRDAEQDELPVVESGVPELSRYGSQLSAPTRRALKTYALQFRNAYFIGKGLWLQASSGTILETSVRYLMAEFTSRRVHFLRLLASDNPQGPMRDEALIKSCLIVERIEYLTPGMTGLLLARRKFRYPLVVTIRRDQVTPHNERLPNWAGPMSRLTVKPADAESSSQ